MVTMAEDDIDIEEHDLFDNPLVRSMFPDLSIIKKEISDFDIAEPVNDISLNTNKSNKRKIQKSPVEDNLLKVFKKEDQNVEQYNKNEKRKIQMSPEEDSFLKVLKGEDQNVEQYYKSKKRKIQMSPVEDSFLKDFKREDQSRPVKQYYNVKKFKKTVKLEMNIKEENVNYTKPSSPINNDEFKNNNFCDVKITAVNDKPSFVRNPKALKKTTGNMNLELHSENLSESSSCKYTNNFASCITSYTSNDEKDSIKQKNKSKEHGSQSPIKQTSSKGNKITLGSKPNTEIEPCINISIMYNVKVSLQNLQSFLSKSSRYCKLCLRLFPSIKALSDHNNVVHPQTDKVVSHEIHLDRKSRISGSRFNCNLCEKVCSSSSNLIRHKRKIHSQKIKKGKKVKIPLIKHSADVETNKELKSFKCTHCKIHFASQQLLIDHMYDVLQSKNKDRANSREKTENNDLNKEKNTTIQKYYRCTFCSYYFKTDVLFYNHLKNTHKKPIEKNWEKVAFEPTCNLCNKKYANILSFNAHAWRFHQKRFMTHEGKSQITEEYKTKPEVTVTLNNDNLQSLPNNVDMDCKKPEDCSTVTKQVDKSFKKSRFILKTALFKCIKCDVCFLSGSKAIDHTKHMDELINWKCLKCFRIFKKEDELLHTYQHLFSDKFDVFEIRTTALLSLLYKCPNCITYFFEKDLYWHYSSCKLQPPNSAYCKICDILIDIKIQEVHDKHHNIIGKELTNMFVESDLIEYIEENVAVEEKKERKSSDDSTIDLKNDNIRVEEKIKTDLDFKVDNSSFEKKEQMLSFVYCNKCNSFISKMHTLYNHTKVSCSNQINFVCKYCGLIISNKLINRHRKVHQRLPGLTLNDFKFYDLKGRTIRRPPIPKYPNCNKCLKHFITKTAIISHKCNEKYLTCPICNTKFSDSAFSLHMAFHDYSPKNNFSVVSDSLALSNLPVKSKTLDLEQNSEIGEDFLLVYICKSCKIAVDIYDKVIEHCQDHLGDKPKETITKACGTCNIIFDITCYDNHKTLHANFYNKQFTVLNFDVFYATSDMNIWLDHLFGSLPREKIDKILDKSIYNTERRVKLKIIQNGLSHLTFYKCDKCKTFMDSSLLYEHCQNNTLCQKLKSSVCSSCGISLVSEEFRIKHEKIHDRQDITLESYRIVLFNSEEDENINRALSLPSQYILFECRNCNGIVDKRLYNNHKCNISDLAKCSHCGLLLYSNDYMAHVLKHKEFCSFIENNMKIILIGQPKDAGLITKGRLMPSFSGVKLDYLVYQCVDCLVCLKEKKTSLIHKCIIRSSLRYCSDCGLYFKEHKFVDHRMMHELDTDFVKENITVIQFGSSCLKKSDKDIIVLDDEDDIKNLNIKKHIERLPETTEDNKIVSVHNLYQCTCGVHFLNESSSITHYSKCTNNPRLVKQTCSKCGLYFKPSVLFEHLLAHHGIKNVSQKFNIIQICEIMPSTSQD